MSAEHRSVVAVSTTVFTMITVIIVIMSMLFTASVLAAPCWPPPVAAPVSDPYRAPSCPWCPGNRGIEFATDPGDVVTSVAAGRVTYAGVIAGVWYVVVEIANGWRITYGRLRSAALGRGDVAVAGMAIGRADDDFHFGLREGEEYLDPTPYLGEWKYPVRLVPTDGSAARPSPPPVVRCGGLTP
ncbi:MAG TPA: M23 family metallopeptidase [Ilumatobacter sp.]|nr:M23 family metallopeptidase [Ilumatobacter sp.]